MRHHRHRALDRLCGTAGVQPHPDAHSTLIDAVVWHRLASAEMHRHRSQEETCIQQDDRCDLHSAKQNT